MPSMGPLPIPCPTPQVPDVTATGAFNSAHQAARTQLAMFMSRAQRQGVDGAVRSAKACSAQSSVRWS
ncbi:hypothetical protein LUW77_00430 [Streptomyces radiopugnans]|nr:hypothetical protein LUW77_00430 [Streptomyces radiopugnans]